MGWTNSFPTPEPTPEPTVPVDVTEKALEMQTAVERDITNIKANSLMIMDSSKTNDMEQLVKRVEEGTAASEDVGRQTEEDEAALQEEQDQFNTMNADAKDAVKQGAIEL